MMPRRRGFASRVLSWRNGNARVGAAMLSLDLHSVCRICYQMRVVTLPLPVFGFIVATRAALAAGLGVLCASRLSKRERRVIGLALVGFGAITTIPAVWWLSQSLHPVSFDRHRAATSR